MVGKMKASEEDMFDLADLFKIFGDSTRIKIIYLIYKRKLCVNEIAVALNMTNSAVSHQLKNLKQSRLVKSEKQGKEVYYTLEDEHIEKIFKLSLEHIEEGKNNE
jgi:ArsR family transcriptional regulator